MVESEPSACWLIGPAFASIRRRGRRSLRRWTSPRKLAPGSPSSSRVLDLNRPSAPVPRSSTARRRASSQRVRLRSGSLDIWLLKHARAAAGAGSARTYVVLDSEQDRVVGYRAFAHIPAMLLAGWPSTGLSVAEGAQEEAGGACQGSFIARRRFCERLKR